MSVYCVRHQPQSSVTSGFCRFCFIFEVSQAGFSTIDRNLRMPLPIPLYPTDAAISGGRTTVAGNVLYVTSTGHNAEITSSVVKFVSVDVVTIKAIARHQAEQLPMQPDSDSSPVHDTTALGVPVDQRPDPLTGPGGIFEIDNGNRSDTPIARAKRDTPSSENLSLDFKAATLASRRIDARATAEQPTAGTDRKSTRKEVRSANATSAWNGTLLWHRLTPSGGVTPPAATNSAGVLRVNYTTQETPQQQAGTAVTEAA